MSELRGKHTWTILVFVAVLSCFFLYINEAGAGDKKSIRYVAGGYWVYGDADDKISDYDLVSINPYFGWLLTPAEDSFTLEFVLEGFVNRHILHFENKYEVGIRPILRLHYMFGRRVSPFIEASTAGILYTNLNVPETGSPWNFSSHVGAGVDVRLWDEWYFSLAYRYRHISNAGLSEHNAGFNHHQGLLGLAYHF
jgi:lipid A 3-O-deacylase